MDVLVYSIADNVVEGEGRLAAGFIRILRSQQKFSFFRPSGAATGRVHHTYTPTIYLGQDLGRARMELTAVDHPPLTNSPL